MEEITMGKKIMIVDDAAFMRMMLKNILVKGGFEVCEEASDGAQAVDKFPQCNPDLVIMDITMPNMDGIEALKKIKSVHPDAKIIMCSAMGQESLVIDAVKSGASDFIVKPFQNDRLLAAIARVLPN
jgi:two-component system chemotaxis response regulator CheY